MRNLTLQWMIRGKPTRTTISDKPAPCPHDHVNRQLEEPHSNALCLSNFSSVSTRADFVYVAFLIDTSARCMVGWRASRTANPSFVLDALEQALEDRRPL